MANQSDSAQRAERMPQQQGAREVRVGLFVLVGAAALVALMFFLTDPATFRGRYMIQTEVENALGLRKGDPVQMRGVNIGRVHDFGMAADQGSVDILLEVEGSWTIPDDSKTRLVTTSLLGGKTVEVVPGTSATQIPDGGHLEGIAVIGLLDDTDALGERATDLMDRLQALLSDDNVDALSGSAQQLEVILTELADVTSSQSEDLKQMVGRLNEASAGLATMAEAAPELKEEFLSAASRADSMLAEMTAASARLDGAATSLEAILGRMERGEGTLGQLSVNDSLYFALTGALDNTRTLLADFQANPGRYINVSIF